MARRTHRKKIVTKYSRININVLKRGKVGFGVLAVLAVIGVFSVALVFGLQQLSPYDSSTSALSYTCCDSGDGEACKPSITKIIEDYRAPVHPQYPADYGLLKTDVHLRSTEHHIDPDPLGQRTSDGDLIFYSPMGTKTALEHPPECPAGGTGKLNPPMDPIYGPPPPGQTELGCYLIPDDQLIYVCRPENEPGECESHEGTANFDVYFRLADYDPENPLDNGIHEVIKNCIKAPVIITPGEDEGQEIIGLPSPSDKPNLQLETFYVTNGPPTAEWISPYCKPAIYLYPESTSFINVKINPLGKILITIPEYPILGWNVIAFPSGDIYHQNTHFDYLFYEASIPDDKIVLPDVGFVIPYNNLNNFLSSLVKKLGLNEKETNQFTEYWLKVLPKSRYYQIKIVEQSELDYISPLNITPFPDSVIRVSLHFTPLEEELSIIEPRIISPIRNGFTVVEWGGIFKKDAAHPFSCFM
jgi:hypothetical protein